MTNLMLGQSFRAGELQISGSAKLISPPDTVIAHVVTIKGGEEAEAAAPVAGAAALLPSPK